MLDCKHCKHVKMIINVTDDKQKIFYTLECSKHGLIADRFAEFEEMVIFENGKPCRCFRRG
jgi:hypothetical protein